MGQTLSSASAPAVVARGAFSTVIASEAKQSQSLSRPPRDCHVAGTPRNDRKIHLMNFAFLFVFGLLTFEF
jgi:hypothetical protein